MSEQARLASSSVKEPGRPLLSPPRLPPPAPPAAPSCQYFVEGSPEALESKARVPAEQAFRPGCGLLRGSALWLSSVPLAPCLYTQPGPLRLIPGEPEVETLWLGAQPSCLGLVALVAEVAPGAWSVFTDCQRQPLVLGPPTWGYVRKFSLAKLAY